MSRTYQGILKGNQLEWMGEAPAESVPVRVEVTVIDQPAAITTPGIEMAKLLEEIAKINPFKEITDPVAWQREIRKDRPLPGREG